MNARRAASRSPSNQNHSKPRSRSSRTCDSSAWGGNPQVTTTSRSPSAAVSRSRLVSPSSKNVTGGSPLKVEVHESVFRRQVVTYRRLPRPRYAGDEQTHTCIVHERDDDAATTVR